MHAFHPMERNVHSTTDTATQQQRADAGRTAPHFWPFAPLTEQQLRERAAMQAALQQAARAPR